MLYQRGPDLLILGPTEVLLLKVLSPHYRHQQLRLISLIFGLLPSIGCEQIAVMTDDEACCLQSTGQVHQPLDLLVVCQQLDTLSAVNQNI